MKTLLLIIGMLVFIQPTATLKLNDLEMLTGNKWKGSLTYLDYGTGKPEKIPVEMTMTSKRPGVYTWLTAFPLEASHDSTDEIIISANGTKLDGETVMERTELPNGTLKLITQTTGNDNNKPATYRITYEFNKTHYSRKREVCYTGETKFFIRNEYILTR